jgi:hypothetical protein
MKIDMDNGYQINEERNVFEIFLHEDCYSKEGLLSFLNDLSGICHGFIDKEDRYYRLAISPIPENIPSTINTINDYQLACDLNKNTEHLKNVVIDFAFGKKKQ